MKINIHFVLIKRQSLQTAKKKKQQQNNNNDNNSTTTKRTIIIVKLYKRNTSYSQRKYIQFYLLLIVFCFSTWCPQREIFPLESLDSKISRMMALVHRCCFPPLYVDKTNMFNNEASLVTNNCYLHYQETYNALVNTLFSTLNCEFTGFKKKTHLYAKGWWTISSRNKIKEGIRGNGGVVLWMPWTVLTTSKLCNSFRLNALLWSIFR